VGLVSRRRLEGEDGAIAILVAVFALVMFGFAAIVVDLGMVRVTKADSRATADSASLAGAAALYAEPNPTPQFGAAIAAVKASAERNGTPLGDWAGCSAPRPAPSWVMAGSGTTCILFDSAIAPRRVFVATPTRRVDAAFGGVLGYSGSDVSASAQAQARDRSMQDCALCVDDFLTVSGRATVDGDGSAIAGRIRVNSGGRLELTSGAVAEGAGIGSEVFPPSPTPPSVRYDPQPDQASPTNPLAGAFPMSLPALGRYRDLTCGASQTVLAGVHYRNLTVNAGCRFQSGLVVVSGRLRVNAGASPATSGTTLYLTCRQGRQVRSCSSATSGTGRLEVLSGGQLDMSGGFRFVGSRPIAVLFDPDNTSTMTVSGTLSIASGSLYKNAGPVTVNGVLEVDQGYVSVDDLTVGSSGRLDLFATGLGSRSGPFRLALVR
jgi:hypothetical protein